MDVKITKHRLSDEQLRSVQFGFRLAPPKAEILKRNIRKSGCKTLGRYIEKCVLPGGRIVSLIEHEELILDPQMKREFRNAANNLNQYMAKLNSIERKGGNYQAFVVRSIEQTRRILDCIEMALKNISK